MKLKIEKKDLVTLLGRSQNIVEKRANMPVLINVLLESEGNALRLFATNLEVSLTGKIPAQVSNPGKVAVNAKNFFDIVKELPEGHIELEKKENNWLKITQGRAEFNIIGISPDEYPVFPTFETDDFIQIESDVFLEMIEKTIYSVATDAARYHLNGVFFEKNKSGNEVNYRMVATDGHRLSLVDRQSSTVGKELEGEGVIIPYKGLNEIRKLIEGTQEDLELAIEGPQLIVRQGETVLLIRLIEGRYPNYQQLIPQKLSETVLLSRESFLSSLKRVSLLSNQKSKGVTLSLSQGRMQITSNNPELGDAREDIEIDYKGKDMKIAFNARYILDILGSIHEDIVQMQFNDHLSPGLIRPKEDLGYTCIVMPMRI